LLYPSPAPPPPPESLPVSSFILRRSARRASFRFRFKSAGDSNESSIFKISSSPPATSVFSDGGGVLLYALKDEDDSLYPSPAPPPPESLPMPFNSFHSLNSFSLFLAKSRSFFACSEARSFSIIASDCKLTVNRFFFLSISTTRALTISP